MVELPFARGSNEDRRSHSMPYHSLFFVTRYMVEKEILLSSFHGFSPSAQSKE
jgi:hypothetical protein